MAVGLHDGPAYAERDAPATFYTAYSTFNLVVVHPAGSCKRADDRFRSVGLQFVV
jgi:hypothetical protein